MVRRVPETITNRIKQITILMRDEFVRNPTGKEVYNFLREEYSQRNAPAWYLPSERYVRQVVSMVKMKPVSDLDSPWSLGKSDEYHIPDEATGAILEVWAWSIKDMKAEPISIRVARWVSKLRWVPDAGGDFYGKVTDPEQLYHAASMYAGRERQVELIKDKKGMRSGVLDAQLMLDPRLQLSSRTLGILEDDDGITYSKEKHED